MKRFAVGYEFICRIIMMVFVVHVAFIVHTLMGLVVGGLFPSVAACYSTYRTWLLDVGDRSWGVKQTWTVFHRAWVDELAGANMFGWPLFAIWVLLVWDYYLVGWNDMGLLGSALIGALLVLNVFYGLFMMVAWAVRSNFDEKPMWVVRMSLQMVIARPWCSIMVAVLFFITVWVYYQWPGLMIAFGVAVPIFTAMMAIYSFGRIPGMDVHVIEPVELRKKDTQHHRESAR